MTDGVGDYVAGLASALAANPGVEVAVLTNEGVPAEGGMRPYRALPLMSTWQVGELAIVRQAIDQVRPDLVHVQYPTLGYHNRELPWMLPAILLSQGIPVHRTWHEHYSDMFSRVRFLAAALPPGPIIVVRPDWAEQRPGWTRPFVPRRRLIHIPNASTLPRVDLTDRERRQVKERYAPDGKALLVYFGFLFEHKGIEEALELVDPSRHHLVLIGEAIPALDSYGPRLLERLGRSPLVERATALGFLPPEEAARLMAAADAVLLPFRRGGGEWNTSLLAAVLQGTFVLTTSLTRCGYDERRNIYFATPQDLRAMREALGAHLGARRDPGDHGDVPTWSEVADRHLAVYERNL
jgi:glycosyltransferase involved in cell wall biosynthesis